MRLLPMLGCAIVVACALVLGEARNGSATPTPAGPADLGNIRVRTGGIIQGHVFNVPVLITTCADSGNPQCRTGAYQVGLTFDPARLSLVSDSGTGAAGSGASTFVDASKGWKINQWAGSRVTITGGAGAGQSRLIVSNTNTTLTVIQPWAAIPDATSSYELGGITNSSWIESSGRTAACAAPIYKANSAALTCVTLGDTTLAPNGSGTVANITFRAEGRGVTALQLSPTDNIVTTQAGEAIDLAKMSGSRRVILCPDSNGSGEVNVVDLLVTAQANGSRTGDPLYTPAKDPDESGSVNVIDLAVTAAVANQRCAQR